MQECPNSFLEGHCPTEFSSNLNETHLNQLSKVFRLKGTGVSNPTPGGPVFISDLLQHICV